MIKPLRRRHDTVFVLLAIALPLLFASSLAVRPDAEALLGEVPDALIRDPNGVSADDRDAVPSGDPAPLAIALPVGMGTVSGLRQSENAAWLDVDMGDLPGTPGLLLYWAPSSSTAAQPDGRLPDGASLLGALRARRTSSYRLPDAALTGDGSLVFYSLGYQAVLGDPVPLDLSASVDR